MQNVLSYLSFATLGLEHILNQAAASTESEMNNPSPIFFRSKDGTSILDKAL